MRPALYEVMYDDDDDDDDDDVKLLYFEIRGEPMIQMIDWEIMVMNFSIIM